MNNTENLPAQIKATRRKLGMSQAQAAIAWGIPVKTLQKWEQGIREPQGLALDALRQKLAAAVVGDAPAMPQPQDDPSLATHASEATGGDLAPAALAAQAASTPPDSTTAASPLDPLPVAAPTPAAAVHVGIEWLPFVSVAHSYARYKEQMKSMPPVTGDVGW